MEGSLNILLIADEGEHRNRMMAMLRGFEQRVWVTGILDEALGILGESHTESWSESLEPIRVVIVDEHFNLFTTAKDLIAPIKKLERASGWEITVTIIGMGNLLPGPEFLKMIDYYLAKPVDEETLREVLSTLLESVHRRTTPLTESQDKVLVADDDWAVRSALETAFRKAGWKVTLATNNKGAKAEIGSSQPFDAVVTDLDMGPTGIEGLDVIRVAKEHSRDTVVILITGCDMEGIMNLARGLGVDEIFRKPVDAVSLIRVIEEKVGARQH